MVWQSSGSPIALSDTGEGGGGLRRGLEIFNPTLVGGRNHGQSGVHGVTPVRDASPSATTWGVLGAEWVVGLITAAHASALGEATADRILVQGPAAGSNDFPACLDVSGWPENLSGDPRLVEATQGDCHLAAGSPALDSGADVSGPTQGFDRLPRPQGSGADVGAFERAP